MFVKDKTKVVSQLGEFDIVRDLTVFFVVIGKFVLKRSRELREDSLNTSLDAG